MINHFNTDITAVPQEWIEEAKQVLHIGYGRTSHGRQLTTGMAGLIDFANGGGLGLSLPVHTFEFSPSGNEGGDRLHLFEGPGWGGDGYLKGDAGYYPDWVRETQAYLGDADSATGRGTNHPEINVIMWAWCVQLSYYSEKQVWEGYLLPMSELEEEYPGITFVYTTGTWNGMMGDERHLHIRNQQIRDYCMENGKVLYDYRDIELYDPDGNYYGDKAVNDACEYDSNGDGETNGNWCLEWQNAHTEGEDWYTCECPHSHPINCNQKAYAAWWLWARLAGWDGRTAAGPQKSASTERTAPGQIVTYTITIRDFGAPLDAIVYLTDELPVGLSYVPGTLTSIGGVVDDKDAPILRWTGVLGPARVVTVSYAALVVTSESEVITNTAVISSPGYEPVTVSASITTQAPDLTPSAKTASKSQGDFGDPITYTVVVCSGKGPLDDTVWLTDTVPNGMVYLPGTLRSTAGLVSEAAAPVLRWTGVLSPSSAITVTYEATVSTTESIYISNHAVVALPGSQIVTRTAAILANPYRYYMPVVVRDD